MDIKNKNFSVHYGFDEQIKEREILQEFASGREAITPLYRRVEELEAELREAEFIIDEREQLLEKIAALTVRRDELRTQIRQNAQVAPGKLQGMGNRTANAKRKANRKGARAIAAH